jgi:S1-C subfamily serine protease
VSVNGVFEVGPQQTELICPACQQQLRTGEWVRRCPACGSLQHQACWAASGRCASYQCDSSANIGQARQTADIVLTPEDLERAPAPVGSTIPPALDIGGGPRRFSRLAIAGFICALAGIALLGIPGAVAVVLCGVAIGAIGHTRRLRGLPIAVIGLIIGILDVAGWGLAGAILLDRQSRPSIPATLSSSEELGISAVQESVRHAPPAIQAALKANVVISTSGLGGKWEGSGVLVRLQAARALILTNRHVVGSAIGTRSAKSLLSKTVDLLFWDGKHSTGRVVWVPPDDLDIVLIECSTPSPAASVARADSERPISVGADVFTVGNPLDLAWTYSKGVVSAVRQQESGSAMVTLIQTQTPLNPGNSGGGLYDADGYLLGIATATGDKSVTEGIGFAIALRTVALAMEGTSWADLFTQPLP